jgi:hypothetical protein
MVLWGLRKVGLCRVIEDFCSVSGPAGPSLPHGGKGREANILLPSLKPEIVECGDSPLQKRLALQKASSSHRTVRNKHRQKLGGKRTASPHPVIYSKEEE